MLVGGIYINNLDNFFNYCIDIEREKNDFGLKRDLPNFKYTINRYREVWNNTETKMYIDTKDILSLKRTEKSQVFKIPFYLPVNCEFTLKIDVDKLKEIAHEIDIMKENENILNKHLRGKDYISKSGSIQSIVLDEDNQEELNGIKLSFPSEVVKSILNININDIDIEYAKTRKNTKDPILCLDMSGLKDTPPPLCIVDGNHQAYEKVYLSNNDLIDMYIISKNLWIKCLKTERDKVFVKIMHNIGCMMSYMLGYGNKQQLNKNMYDL